MTSYLKIPLFRSEKFRRLVTSLPCQCCGKEGTQAAHRNEGKSMALIVALCPDCHRELDQGMNMSRAERLAMWDAQLQ